MTVWTVTVGLPALLLVAGCSSRSTKPPLDEAGSAAVGSGSALVPAVGSSSAVTPDVVGARARPLLAGSATLSGLSGPQRTALCEEFQIRVPDAKLQTKIACSSAAMGTQGPVDQIAKACRATLSACLAGPPSAVAKVACPEPTNAAAPATACGTSTVADLRTCADEIDAVAHGMADRDVCALYEKFAPLKKADQRPLAAFIAEVTPSPACQVVRTCMQSLFMPPGAPATGPASKRPPSGAR